MKVTKKKAGIVAGCVIAALVVLAIIVVVAWDTTIRKKQARHQKTLPAGSGSNGGDHVPPGTITSLQAMALPGPAIQVTVVASNNHLVQLSLNNGKSWSQALPVPMDHVFFIGLDQLPEQAQGPVAVVVTARTWDSKGGPGPQWAPPVALLLSPVLFPRVSVHQADGSGSGSGVTGSVAYSAQDWGTQGLQFQLHVQEEAADGQSAEEVLTNPDGFTGPWPVTLPTLPGVHAGDLVTVTAFVTDASGTVLAAGNTQTLRWRVSPVPPHTHSHSGSGSGSSSSYSWDLWPLGAVELLTTTSSASAILVSWEPPMHWGPPVLHKYMVYLYAPGVNPGPDPGSSPPAQQVQTVPAQPGVQPTALFQSLQVGSYTVVVVPVGSDGSVGPAAMRGALVGPGPGPAPSPGPHPQAGRPDAPTQVLLLPVPGSAAVVTWQPPARITPDRPATAAFVVALQATPASGAPALPIQTISATDANWQALFTGLQAGAVYQAMVMACPDWSQDPSACSAPVPSTPASIP
jgi:hypothetical protein